MRPRIVTQVVTQVEFEVEVTRWEWLGMSVVGGSCAASRRRRNGGRRCTPYPHGLREHVLP